jgi:hypothetical protein
MLEYMPGTWASSSLFGSGSRNLSGFHSNASSPQYSLLRFRLRKLTNISVPRGTATSCSCDPSVAVIGVKRGRTMSLDALPYVISVSRRSLTKGLTIGRSSAREHSWKKKKGQQIMTTGSDSTHSLRVSLVTESRYWKGKLKLDKTHAGVIDAPAKRRALRNLNLHLCPHAHELFHRATSPEHLGAEQVNKVSVIVHSLSLSKVYCVFCMSTG